MTSSVFLSPRLRTPRPETTFSAQVLQRRCGLVKQLRKRILGRQPAWWADMVLHVETFTGRRPTMKEVARTAGVSLATVSRVVNGTGDVRPDLVDRVNDAVRMLGYRRDLTASTLRRADRQSASIGLIIE